MVSVRACFVVACLLLLSSLFPPAAGADLLLQNDGFLSGQNAAFQGGFIAGEMAASRFTPPGTVQVKRISLLFGGDTTQKTVTLHIWDDSGLTSAPGVELFSGDYQLTGANDALNEIDLTSQGIFVSSTFRVGIEFQHSGFPSVARDDDGTITGSLNYIYASGLGWWTSDFFGLTGDWILRALVSDPVSGFTVGGTVSGLDGTLVLQNNGGDDLVVGADGPFTFGTPLADSSPYEVTVLSAPVAQDCVVSMGTGTIAGADVNDVVVSCTDKVSGPVVLQYDSFESGQSAGFQGGFVANEIAAVRFVPPGSTTLQAVRFLFGGDTGTRSIRLHVWDDSAETLDPGVELFAQDYEITASDAALQEIDLTTQSIAVSAPFRVGVELLASGLPSVARDDDGTISASVNLLYASGVGWDLSSNFGLTGDWILRAIVTGDFPEPTLLAVEDVGNDQGGQVRLRFGASSQDAAAASEPVLSYEAYRRIDPLPSGIAPPAQLGKLDGWDYVGEVPAHGESVYNMVVPTLADSNLSQGMHWSVFFVRAATAIPTLYYDAAPDSGWSVDNLAPAPPANLVYAGGELSWDPAAEDDFDYHGIYGSTTGLRDGSESLLGTTSANSFDVSADPSPFYLVTTFDFAGNEGDPSAVQNSATSADSPTRRSLWARVHPNPFNPATSVEFSLPEAGPVTIRIFDQRGRRMDTLVENRVYTAGDHALPYRSSLPSGMYFLEIRQGDAVASVKMSLVR